MNHDCEIDRLKRESNEAMRSGKIVAAVKLYNEAFELERDKERVMKRELTITSLEPVAIEYNEVWWVSTAMMKYGGNFIHDLGLALRGADEENTERIRETWPGYWERFRELGMKMKEKEKEESDEHIELTVTRKEPGVAQIKILKEGIEKAIQILTFAYIGPEHSRAIEMLKDALARAGDLDREVK